MRPYNKGLAGGEVNKKAITQEELNIIHSYGFFLIEN